MAHPYFTDAGRARRKVLSTTASTASGNSIEFCVRFQKASTLSVAVFQQLQCAVVFAGPGKKKGPTRRALLRN